MHQLNPELCHPDLWLPRCSLVLLSAEPATHIHNSGLCTRQNHCSYISTYMHFVPTVTRALIDVCIIHDAMKKGQQLAYAQRTTPWYKHGYFTDIIRVDSTVQYSNAKLTICIWCNNLWWLDGIIDPIWLTFRLGFCEITFWLISIYFLHWTDLVKFDFDICEGLVLIRVSVMLNW